MSDIDRSIYGVKNPGLSKREVLEIWGDYGEYSMNENSSLSASTLNKCIVNLMDGEKLAIKFRRMLGDVQYFRNSDGYADFMQFVIKSFE